MSITLFCGSAACPVPTVDYIEPDMALHFVLKRMVDACIGQKSEPGTE